MDMTKAEDSLTHRSIQDHVNPREEWDKFLNRCLSSRLDVDTFESYIPMMHSRYPLPPAIIADIFLKPQPSNPESLDPRIPRYFQGLVKYKLIDTPSILKALYKYSTSHAQASKAGNGSLENSEDKTHLRWGNSYGAEEVIFYRLTKAVAMGSGIGSSGDALQICKLMAQWMTLFTSASTAFAHDVMSQLHSPQSRDEMEAARAAFVMLLLAICESQTFLNALSRPFAKCTCLRLAILVPNTNLTGLTLYRCAKGSIRKPSKLYSVYPPECIADCQSTRAIPHRDSCLFRAG